MKVIFVSTFLKLIVCLRRHMCFSSICPVYRPEGILFYICLLKWAVCYFDTTVGAKLRLVLLFLGWVWLDCNFLFCHKVWYVYFVCVFGDYLGVGVYTEVKLRDGCRGKSVWNHLDTVISL